MKENIPEEKESDDKGEEGKDTNNGLDVSSDEEDADKEGEEKEGQEGGDEDKVCIVGGLIA